MTILIAWIELGVAVGFAFLMFHPAPLRKYLEYLRAKLERERMRDVDTWLDAVERDALMWLPRLDGQELANARKSMGLITTALMDREIDREDAGQPVLEPDRKVNEQLHNLVLGNRHG